MLCNQFDWLRSSDEITILQKSNGTYVKQSTACYNLAKLEMLNILIF